MKSKLFRRPKALADIEESAMYIGRENPTSAMRFIDAAESTMQLLADNSGLGSERSFARKELLGLRAFPVKGFEKHLVFYRPAEHGIEVLRVLHGAQDLRSILKADVYE